MLHTLPYLLLMSLAHALIQSMLTTAETPVLELGLSTALINLMRDRTPKKYADYSIRNVAWVILNVTGLVFTRVVVFSCLGNKQERHLVDEVFVLLSASIIAVLFTHFNTPRPISGGVQNVLSVNPFIFFLRHGPLLLIIPTVLQMSYKSAMTFSWAVLWRLHAEEAHRCEQEREPMSKRQRLSIR